MPSGIVETDYVKEQKERVKDVLLKNKLIALFGETGTGKTEIAGKIAEELTDEYEFVNDHAFMTKEYLFSYELFCEDEKIFIKSRMVNLDFLKIKFNKSIQPIVF